MAGIAPAPLAAGGLSEFFCAANRFEFHGKMRQASQRVNIFKKNFEPCGTFSTPMNIKANTREPDRPKGSPLYPVDAAPPIHPASI
jgi:hypothetical protein